MKEEDNNNNEYYIFIGMILFFLIVGIYIIFNLVFNRSPFDILGNFINVPVEEPAKIENVELKRDIFTKEKFKELELSNNYKFDINGLVVGGKNPFVIKPLNAKEKK
ncbi:hypothetical protein L6270_02630 [Candidatus Parcubacteria bacterium]|nr:hypothetical protein [Patescibacteria group bacterium]MBU4309920.1 hypothetical protein [Patescibacteria group bacterium]MBU4432077.1 hypothetical protein [Patescibacteria group bacterium]MBU4577845.1 hypothetical protein [Patescibacteria group bacterium]MCG2696906.1 hypothetical protein [Candidatus Parcubacteria bacterium]